MIAYSSISQGGFVPMPLGGGRSCGSSDSALRAAVVYMIIYAATNLCMFKLDHCRVQQNTKRRDHKLGGLFSYAPRLGALATIFWPH